MLVKPVCLFIATFTVLLAVSPISSTKLLLAKKVAFGAHAIGAHVAVKTALHAKSTAFKAAVKVPIAKFNGLVKAKVAPALGLFKTSKFGKFGLIKGPKIAKLTKLTLPIVAPLAALKAKPAAALLGAASLKAAPFLGLLGAVKPPVPAIAPLGALKLTSLGLVNAGPAIVAPAVESLSVGTTGIAGTLLDLLKNNPIAGAINKVTQSLTQPEVPETTYSFVPSLGVSNYNTVHYTPLDTSVHNVAYAPGVNVPVSSTY